MDRNLSLDYGEILSLGSSFFYAMQIVAVGHFAKESDGFVLSTVQMTFAAVISLSLAFIVEPSITSFNNEMVVPIVYLAIFSSMIAFLTQNIAQKYTSSTHAAIILKY